MLKPPKLHSLIVTRSCLDKGSSAPFISYRLPVRIGFSLDEVVDIIGMGKWDQSQSSYQKTNESLFNRGSHFERMVGIHDGRKLPVTNVFALRPPKET